MDIKLKFINESNDRNNSDIVIFQKNEAVDYDECVVAWRVIKNCGVGSSHLFVFPYEMQISATDSWGNETYRLRAEHGQSFHAYKDHSGVVLAHESYAGSEYEIYLKNHLEMGSVSANMYRDGKLLATKTNIPPEQKAVFRFKPTLWIGAVSNIEEGQVMNSAIISDINTEFNLLGVVSADIVMTGGGSAPLHFTLENIVLR